MGKGNALQNKVLMLTMKYALTFLAGVVFTFWILIERTLVIQGFWFGGGVVRTEPDYGDLPDLVDGVEL